MDDKVKTEIDNKKTAPKEESKMDSRPAPKDAKSSAPPLVRARAADAAAKQPTPAAAGGDETIMVKRSEFDQMQQQLARLSQRMGPDPSAAPRRAKRQAQPDHVWVRHTRIDGSYRLVAGPGGGEDLIFAGDDPEYHEKEVHKDVAEYLCGLSHTTYDDNGNAETRKRFERMPIE